MEQTALLDWAEISLGSDLITVLCVIKDMGWVIIKPVRLRMRANTEVVYVYMNTWIVSTEFYKSIYMHAPTGSVAKMWTFLQRDCWLCSPEETRLEGIV